MTPSPSLLHRCRWRRRVALALLAGTLALPPAAAAQWTVRAEPAVPGRKAGCVLESERQPLPDGYQDTWAQIVVDREAIRVTSASKLDPGDADIGLVVDDGPFVPVDEVAGERTAVFTTRYAALVEDFKQGLKVRVQLRFWPTWPKTSTHSATFSLIGFTRTHARLADCRTP
jgi:hypothetical protein